MIVFHYVKWKNFLSTGSEPTTINFQDCGMTMIVGGNGNGKSTLLDAVCFALFNKPFRNVTKTQLINSVNTKNCMVEIAFSIGEKQYKIIRGIKPNIFEVYENGEKIEESANLRDMQEYLESNIIRINYRAFTQIVILGSATFVPFMQLPAASRRTIVEELLDTSVFGVMNTLLKEKITAIKEDLTDAESNLRSSTEKVKMQEEFIKKITKSKEAEREALRVEIAELETELADATDKYNAAVVAHDEFLFDDDPGLATSQKELIGAIGSLNGKISEIANQIRFLTEHDDCPTCNQSLDNQFKADKLEKLEADRAKALEIRDKLKRKQAKLDAAITEGQANKNKKRSLASAASTAKATMDAAKTSLNRQKTKLAGLVDDTTAVDEEVAHLDDLKGENAGLGEKVSALKEKKATHDVCLKLLKDDGIKASVVKMFLPVINKKVNEYLAMMDFFVEFELDESFNETIRSRYRDVFSYASFSEGEKQRINLALLFTWRSIAKMRNNHNTNLLLMDETLDGSLDQAATENLMDILHAEVENFGTHVFVITHSPDAYREHFDRTLKFQKKDNFSFMVEEES